MYLRRSKNVPSFINHVIENSYEFSHFSVERPKIPNLLLSNIRKTRIDREKRDQQNLSPLDVVKRPGTTHLRLKYSHKPQKRLNTQENNHSSINAASKFSTLSVPQRSGTSFAFRTFNKVEKCQPNGEDARKSLQFSRIMSELQHTTLGSGIDEDQTI